MAEHSIRIERPEQGALLIQPAWTEANHEVKHHTDQPSKAELEKDVSIDATPQEVARALMEPVTVYEKKDGR